MTTLATESWTGTNGAAWPAQWTTAPAATINSNQGVITTGAAFYSGFHWARLTGMAATSSTDLVLDVTHPTNLECYQTIGVRADTDVGGPNESLYPLNGYSLLLASPSGSVMASLVRTLGGTKTTVVPDVASGATASVARRIRIRADGPRIQVRSWDPAGTEPGTWLIDYTDPSPYLTAGRVWLSAQSGAEAVSRAFRYDNLTVTDIAPATPAGPHVRVGGVYVQSAEPLVRVAGVYR